MTSPEKTISLVIPLYNEEEVIPYLFDELTKSCRELTTYNWELVLIDDGSLDNTVAEVERHSDKFPWSIHLIHLSRNFGHQAALTAGISEARGDALICLDADLQDPPDLFPSLLNKFEEGFDVVYAIRKSRPEGILLKTAFKLFYQIFKRISNIEIAMDSGDFGLISRRVAEHITSMPERDILLRGLRSWVGFKQTGVEYDRPERIRGETKYRLSQRFKVAGGAFFGFSHLPLRISTWIGSATASLAVLYFLYILVRRLLGFEQIPGWLSLTSLVLLMGGVQLITIGVLGEYIGRIYQQVQARPLYIIARHSHLTTDDDPLDKKVEEE